MSNQRLGITLALFWFIFPFPLILLGYGNISTIQFSDFMINPTSFLSIAPSNIPILDSILGVAKFVVTIVVAIMNLIILVVSFVFIYLKALTLTFNDINWLLARFINVIQIITAIFVVYFLRRG